MQKVLAIIGARPQFIKHAPVELELQKEFELVTIHTGQHYDDNMSKVFFDELKISKPEYILDLGGYSHGKQTGMMMMQIEDIVTKQKPDAILVYGDTNSTLAGALVGAKLHIPVFHIEAGLRSYNKSMPEEINRVLADHVSDMFFIPSEAARKNLENEGIYDNIFNVGDVMYDM
ncbi:MAG TPA: UDP-N-acetyl glucosamine 2-epimerase, partial [Bacteroidetes bacterium]|nr:UDP-N-acetyl glucosamine 2-epimerase [Bacteroidota bacterium]